MNQFESFIETIDCISSTILIHECVELIDTLYDKTAIKCVNLFTPEQDANNNDIIARECKNTQDFIYDFIVSCSFQLHKETIKNLKKYTRETKYKTTQRLYEVLKEI